MAETKTFPPLKIAKTLKKYLKAHHHLSSCLKYKSQSLDIKDAFKLLRRAVQTQDDELSRQLNSDWTESTISLIATHFEEVIVDLEKKLKESDNINWKEEWIVAVNWCRREMATFSVDVTALAEKKLREQLDTVLHQQTEAGKCSFRRHDKCRNWNLTVHRPILIIGDSNTSRLPKIYNNRVQVDSYPGARLCHGLHILKKTPKADQVQKVILSFGIDDRNAADPNTLKPHLAAIYRVAKEKFPNASIVIPIINYSKYLATKSKSTLMHLNRIIIGFPHIPQMAEANFHTGRDNIQWTPKTAKKVLSHWRVNFGF